ncbi:MAG: exonuclease domain-containing protein [Bacteroidota bacterium]
MNLLFIDTETTGLNETDRLIQVGHKLRLPGYDSDISCELFKPAVPISFEAMAVHHITYAMVEDKETFASSPLKIKLQQMADNTIFIAHNAKFDLRMFQKEDVYFKLVIDTYRVAMHLIDLPCYKLQYLRYALDFNVDAVAHDAAGDVAVLEKLWEYLYMKAVQNLSTSEPEKVIDYLLTLSSSPVLLKTFSFGKYKDKTFLEVAGFDRSYLSWLWNSEVSKIESDRNEDLVYTLSQYLNHSN